MAKKIRAIGPDTYSYYFSGNCGGCNIFTQAPSMWGSGAYLLPRDGEDKALEGLTLAGARMLDLGERVGSLEVGKDADFAILDGAPFSVYTHVLETWVEGRKVFAVGELYADDVRVAEAAGVFILPSE